MELVDDGRLTDTRIAGDEHQLRPAARHHTVEGGKQSLGLPPPAIELLGNQQPVWGVVFGQREFVDAPPSFPISEATPKITLHARRRQVAFLRSLSQHLHNNGRDGERYVLQPLARRHRLSAMWQCTHSIGSEAVKGRLPVSIS